MTQENIAVVVAFDFTTTAEVVLARGIDLASRAPWHVLHVVAALDQRSGLSAIPPEDAVDYRYAEKVQEHLRATLEKAFTARDSLRQVHFFTHVRFGKPGEQILRVARDVSADLILVGSHGRTGIERLVLGSTSEEVVRAALCPVMVVRDKTYPDVKLMDVHEVPFQDKHYVPPHRYTYEQNQVLMRHSEWPQV